MRTRVMAGLVLLLIVGSAVPSAAQYFGRNKVQYEKFDFKIMKTDHFDIYYYPEEEDAVRVAARMAERWYLRLTRLLQHDQLLLQLRPSSFRSHSAKSPRLSNRLS